MKKKKLGLKFDYWALRGEIRRRGWTIKELAELAGMSHNMLYRKLSNVCSMTQEDVVVISELMGFGEAEIGGMFFTLAKAPLRGTCARGESR